MEATEKQIVFDRNYNTPEKRKSMVMLLISEIKSAGNNQLLSEIKESAVDFMNNGGIERLCALEEKSGLYWVSEHDVINGEPRLTLQTK